MARGKIRGYATKAASAQSPFGLEQWTLQSNTPAGAFTKSVVVGISVFVIWVLLRLRQRVAPKGRVPIHSLKGALQVLAGKQVSITFEPDEFEMEPMSAAMEREIKRMFREAGCSIGAGAKDHLSVIVSSHRVPDTPPRGRVLQYRFESEGKARYGPFPFQDVELTGRASTLSSAAAQSIAKATGYAEQLVYDLAVFITDPTGNTKL